MSSAKEKVKTNNTKISAGLFESYLSSKMRLRLIDFHFLNLKLRVSLKSFHLLFFVYKLNVLIKILCLLALHLSCY